MQDLATQIYFWNHFRSSCKDDKVKPGRFLNPEVAEFLHGASVASSFHLPHWCQCQCWRFICWGVPRGWTNSKPGSVSEAEFFETYPHLKPDTDKAKAWQVFLLPGVVHVNPYRSNVSLISAYINIMLFEVWSMISNLMPFRFTCSLGGYCKATGCKPVLGRGSAGLGLITAQIPGHYYYYVWSYYVMRSDVDM